jgi:hypothetical protein
MEGDHLQDLDILKWIFKKQDRRRELDCSGSGQGQVAGTRECGNEPSGSAQCGEFQDSL